MASASRITPDMTAEQMARAILALTGAPATTTALVTTTATPTTTAVPTTTAKPTTTVAPTTTDIPYGEVYAYNGLPRPPANYYQENAFFGGGWDGSRKYYPGADVPLFPIVLEQRGGGKIPETSASIGPAAKSGGAVGWNALVNIGFKKWFKTKISYHAKGGPGEPPYYSGSLGPWDYFGFTPEIPLRSDGKMAQSIYFAVSRTGGSRRRGSRRRRGKKGSRCH